MSLLTWSGKFLPIQEIFPLVNGQFHETGNFFRFTVLQWWSYDEYRRVSSEVLVREEFWAALCGDAHGWRISLLHLPPSHMTDKILFIC